MRIPGRKIWRAFRELDEFSDEQCRRFVNRASPWGWRKSIRAGLGVAMGTSFMLATIFLLLLYTVGNDGVDDFGGTALVDVFYPQQGSGGSGSGMAIDFLLNATSAEWESACEP
ncbi:MAG: hypothetical protein ACREJD_08765 [Phycisphaerales bacterium]